MYLVVDEQSKKAAIVDPVNIDSVLNTAKSQGVELTHALVTHHHWVFNEN